MQLGIVGLPDWPSMDFLGKYNQNMQDEIDATMAAIGGADPYATLGARKEMPADLMADRALYMFVAEAVRCLEEGVLPGPIEGDTTAAIVEHARETGDAMEEALAKRLRMLDRVVEIRRFDVLSGDVARIAAREARSDPFSNNHLERR